MRKPTILMVIPYGFNDRLINFPEFTLSRLLARHGWRVFGLTRREAEESGHETTHGIDVYRYRGTPDGVARLLWMLITKRPHIVHVHMLRNNRVGVVAAMLARLFRIPLAFSEAGLLHDHYLTDDRDDPLEKPIHYERVARHPSEGVRSYFFHWPLLHADAVVFYSKHNVPIAKKLGIKSIRYIPLIVDNARRASSGTRDENRALPQEPFGLFVGQMKERKGWNVLLHAIALTPRQIMPSFVFISSSSTAETERFTTLVGSLHLRDRVHFLGRASNAELQSAYERASLVVVPSRYEGFGLVPLEAFEAGCPVIASRVEALTDYLVHEKNVLLVPPDNSRALSENIVRVLSDATVRERIVRGGRETRAEMESEARAKEWLDFFRDIVANRYVTS